MKSRDKRTCGGGNACTLDEGHKGECVPQRMPEPADDYDPPEYTFEMERESNRHRGYVPWKGGYRR